MKRMLGGPKFGCQKNFKRFSINENDLGAMFFMVHTSPCVCVMHRSGSDKVSLNENIQMVPKAPSSARTVARAVQLLRLVASSKTRHLRLMDLAEMASLDKSTAHRLLQRLVEERLLVRDDGERGYRLG